MRNAQEPASHDPGDSSPPQSSDEIDTRRGQRAGSGRQQSQGRDRVTKDGKSARLHVVKQGRVIEELGAEHRQRRCSDCGRVERTSGQQSHLPLVTVHVRQCVAEMMHPDGKRSSSQYGQRCGVDPSPVDSPCDATQPARTAVVKHCGEYDAKHAGEP